MQKRNRTNLTNIPGNPRSAGIAPRLALAALSGVMLALSMPRPGWWALAWIGLAPLFVAMRGARPREAALLGLVAGSVYYGVVLFWLTIFGYLPWVIVSTLLCGGFVALFAPAASLLMPWRIGWWGYVAVPAAWTAMQWARSLGPLGFTWGSLAHTQANVPALIQLSSLTGPWGIDFLLCLASLAVAGALFPTDGRRRLLPLTATIALAAAAWGAGHAVLQSAPNQPGQVKVAIIQPGIAQDAETTPDYIAQAFHEFSEMSCLAAQENPDIIVWPETALPVRVTGSWDALMSRLAVGTGTNYIVGGYGAPEDPSDPRNHNGAHFYNRAGRKLGVYRKVHLVPYGEFVPLREQCPFVERYGVRPVDVKPGQSHALIDTEFGKMGVSICFESLFPRISRMETRAGAAALFVITNDSWFGQSQAARQHLMMSKLRAVENRRYVVRGAATGISTIIDPYGRSLGELNLSARGILTGRISPTHAVTPYARLGDAFAYVCLFVTALSLVASTRRIMKNAISRC